MHEPKSYRAIMVSSTFTDLKAHRQQVIEAIHRFDYRANVMEHDGARPDVDVIDSSLSMVRDSAAYVGVISRKYGQTPVCPRRNPERVSITELEFNEAMRLGRPILLFIMGDKHPVTEGDVELDPDKRKKLEAFRERAKRIREGSEVNRIYQVFESLEQFSTGATTAVGRLAPYLASKETDTPDNTARASKGDAKLPRPPTLAALPRYLGSHPFVGRASELQTLTDWCGPADPNPIVLFEAMGGSGKSMLTWEWLTNHATGARADWAGRFWYSFYEKGAVMAGFCRHALSYMTAKSVEEFAKLRTPELSDRLMAELEKRPWLVVLDGLERILVAYHRHDAAQLPDEEADAAADQIGKRDPCAAIRPEDDELLRRLAAVAPSKILVSSRLTPRALVNRSGTRIPGVRREILPGLRPPDAEKMISACGVKGNSQAIQAYLQTNCDCHPLVVGALAGLINDYPPDRGNFDRWAEDPRHGGLLDLAKLDLAQRRNHILLAAIDALTPEGRLLLQTLALLQAGADFETLTALNPHLPPEPKEAPEPWHPMSSSLWPTLDEKTRARFKLHYEAAAAQRKSYLDALAMWKSNPAARSAATKLADTIRDLEKRGLLQYDLEDKRYDLHPVVRGVAAGRMSHEETRVLGQKVVDHFTSQPHNPWEQAETLDDVAHGLQIVRVLLRMQRYEEAFRAYDGDLVFALFANLDAIAEMQALLKPFFPDGWGGEPVQLDNDSLDGVLNLAGFSLTDAYPDLAWKLLERAVALNTAMSHGRDLGVRLQNLARISWATNRLAEATRLLGLAREIAEVMHDNEELFASKLRLLRLTIEAGDHKASDRMWREIDKMGREWSRAGYRAGDAEIRHAVDLFYRSELTEEALVQAETLASNGRNRDGIQNLKTLRGEWHLARDEPAAAVESLAQAVRMAREVSREDTNSEALLTHARLRSGDRFDARLETERLSKNEGKAALAVAELWQVLGERDRAVERALCAHRWAVADGEPHIHRFYLDRTRALLADLGAALPEVPRCEPSKVTTYPWEKDVRIFIDGQRAETVKKSKHKARKNNFRKGENRRK